MHRKLVICVIYSYNLLRYASLPNFITLAAIVPEFTEVNKQWSRFQLSKSSIVSFSMHTTELELLNAF